jgi:DNA-binding CsgD family transcriptional regulator
LLKALAFVQVVQAAPSLDAYRSQVLGLRALVPCDAIGYNEVDLERGETFAVLEPADAAFDGAEDQLSFILPSPPGTTVGIALNRSTRGFSVADRELIELIRPHLTQAFRDARMRDAADPLAPARLRGLGLSDREAQVMALLVEGLSAATVAERLSISPHTARHHIAGIYAKLGVSSRAAAVTAVLRA